MLKAAKWKQEKIKIKAVFRLQFHATHIPRTGWDKLFVSFIPAESGKATARTKKANARNGSCKWADPIYETTRLLQDSKTKKCDGKIYKVVVAMGMSRSGVLGEAEINIAEFYEEASKPVDVALPLHGIDCGAVLHVTLQLLTSKTGFSREFEQQSEIRERSLVEEEAEAEEAVGSEFRSDGSNVSPRSLRPEHDAGGPKNTCSGVFSGDSSGPSPAADLRKARFDDAFEQQLALELASSSRLLSKQVSSLESECSNIQQDLKFLEVSEQMPRFSDEELASVEGGLRDLRKKALFAEDGIGLSLCPDIDTLLETLRNFEPGFELGPGKAPPEHALEAEMLQLQARLGESLAEQGILESRIHELEREFEYFVNETREIQGKMAAESKSLRHECSTCIHTVSSAKSEVEDTNRRVSGLLVERDGLVSTNRELERRAVCSEETLEKARKRYSVSVGQLQSDLDLLSHQVSSVFVAGGRLVEETSDLSSENLLDSSRDIEYTTQQVREPDTEEEVSEGISGENSCLGEKVEQFEREILQLEEENRELRIRSDSAVLELGNEKARFLLEIGHLGSEIELQEQEILQLEEDNRGLRIGSDSDMREIREEKARFFLEIGGLGSEIERLEQENFQLNEDKRSLRIGSDSDMREVREEKARFFLEIGGLRSEIERLEQENFQLEEQNRSLRIRSDFEMHRGGEEKAGFLLEIGCLGSEIEYLEQEIIQLEEENRMARSKSDSEMDKAGAEKAQFLLEIGHLESEIEQTRVENGLFFVQISILRAGCRDLEEAVEVQTGEAISGAVILDILTEKIRILVRDLAGERLGRRKWKEESARFENLLLGVEESERTENLIGHNIMLEVRDAVLESELKAQILEAEELRKIAGRVHENPVGMGRETLRVALMKEQYEVRIEDLEQKLLGSRKHGGEMLLRLQEAADELEKRKKAEASESRRNEEMRAVLKAEGLSRRLEVCEGEKKALETFLMQCREELGRLRGATAEGGIPGMSTRTPDAESVGGIEVVEEVEIEEEEAHCFKSTIDSLHSQLEMLVRENYPSDPIPTLMLKQENDEVGPTCNNGSMDVLERVLALETQLALALNSTHHHSREEEEGRGGIEGELVEMQERYSKLSLMFAEVEGERQRLVMTLKNFRSLPP